MSRRKLSELQRRRISRRREELGANAARAELALHRGQVVARFGRHAEIVADDRTVPVHCDIRPSLAREIVCGDLVQWRDLPDGRGVIEQRLPRVSELCRPGPRGDPRVVAANLDKLLIVAAARPAPDLRLLDQYLVCAERAGLAPVLVLNKMDLPESASAEAALAAYLELGYPLVTCSAQEGHGIDRLETAAEGATCTLVGQSGVGKSSLVGRLSPESDPVIGALSQAQATGRHTTTTTRMYPLGTSGRLIDAPGIREFPLLPMPREELQRCFPEFRPLLGQCRFHNCRHLSEPDCALRAAAESAAIPPWRFAHFLEFADQLADPAQDPSQR